MTVDVAYTAGSGSATSWAVVPSSPLGVIGRFYSDVTVPSLNGGQLAGLRNRIINGNFGINQRVVSGSVVLAAGAYGHDRWKAGAAGCTYTFATSNNVTTLTISAGSLQQVVEGLNLESGTYCLSWTGTAQGKVGAGAYSASGVTRAVTGGTNTTIEFNTGTLSLVQLEIGSATTFEQRPYATELLLCLRYYQRLQMEQRFTATGVGQVLTVTRTTAVPMRASPTFTQITAGTLTNASAATMTAVTASEAQAVLTASGSGDCFVTARVFETSGTEL